MRLAGWGRYPVHDTTLRAVRDEADVMRHVGAAHVAAGPLIARGNGRAYGDSAVGAALTLDMRGLNRLIAFDPQEGVLVAEAGVLLSDIIGTFLPRGWFPAVTPGTKFVTLGGMIAADVHGKNHHLDGSFGNFVAWIELIDGTGTLRRCSRTQDSELFAWTIGGMGLTGVIVRAAIRLRPVETAWIRQTVIPAESLDAAMRIFDETAHATYSVAWIDCLSRGTRLGRSLVMLGEHAVRGELSPAQRAAPLDAGACRQRGVPFDLPSGLLNGLSVRAFNALYYRRGAAKAGTGLVDWDSYFYPLDSILHWNRIYGRRGFAQFQCALPLERARDGLLALLEAVSRNGSGSFLAALKRFGAQDSRFSFPMPGYTLALDFPVRARTLALMDALDEIVIAHCGRFYLAKDSRMRAETLRRADRRVDAFRAMREAGGLDPVFQSMQARRLEL